MTLHEAPTVSPPIGAIFFAAAFLGLFYFFFTKPESPEKSVAR
ncbi:MAG: hypothetical protein ACYCYO_08685 [Bacilli bacterium]